MVKMQEYMNEKYIRKYSRKNSSQVSIRYSLPFQLWMSFFFFFWPIFPLGAYLLLFSCLDLKNYYFYFGIEIKIDLKICKEGARIRLHIEFCPRICMFEVLMVEECSYPIFEQVKKYINIINTCGIKKEFSR